MLISDVIETPEDFFRYNFGYDVIRDSTKKMKSAFAYWELPKSFFEKKPGDGVYP